MPPTRRLLIVLTCLLGTISCDHATKQLANEHLRDGPVLSYLGGLVRLVHTENPGAFLSLGAAMDAGWRFAIFTVAVGVLLAALLAYALVSRRLRGLEVAAFAVLAAGGLSNWIDRVANEGRVVDFLILGAGSLRTGVFNVADVAIVAAIPLLFLAGRQRARAEPSSPTGTQAP